MPSAGRSYIDGHASYGVDRIEGFYRRNGTPLIALDAHVETNAGKQSRFTQLWFVEIDPARAVELQRRIDERGATDRASVIVGDINREIVNILAAVPIKRPAICCLDPYDPPGLYFDTIRRIAQVPGRANKIELFVNLPIGLQHRQARDPATGDLRASVVDSLERLIGNRRWVAEFEQWAGGRGSWPHAYQAMKREFLQELRQLGYKFFCQVDVPPVSPMYALVFASDHPLAEKIMKKAIGNWERDPANIQRPLI
jgi:three-Cys-motif partner protein